MEVERYAGERRALVCFLAGLRPLVRAELGRDSVLYHRIDRALKRADLDGLRNARRMFHSQPRALKRCLLQGLLEPATAERQGGRSTGAEPAPTTFVRFGTPAEPWRPDRVSVTLAHEQAKDHAVQVLIRPGTLPRAAASALRAIADRIEGERRLLSPRYWKRGGDGAESADQA